jgi:S-adenosylmethionine:diacylglycerol 3-amino-3-carboxypropyl transferase
LAAGDNVLDFIIDGAKVTAVDLNACQLALCSLKRAAILELPHEEFFRIFAKQDVELLRKYADQPGNALSDPFFPPPPFHLHLS